MGFCVWLLEERLTRVEASSREFKTSGNWAFSCQDVIVFKYVMKVYEIIFSIRSPDSFTWRLARGDF